jgi:hypothetical protein
LDQAVVLVGKWTVWTDDPRLGGQEAGYLGNEFSVMC